MRYCVNTFSVLEVLFWEQNSQAYTVKAISIQNFLLSVEKVWKGNQKEGQEAKRVGNTTKFNPNTDCFQQGTKRQ